MSATAPVYYLGKIAKILNRVTYQVEVTIDGIVENKYAIPFSRGEMDEPKVGDDVMLRNIDPLYGSMYLYEKLKEDKFIGFRSNGKAVEITPDYIEVTVYPRDPDDSSDGIEVQSAHDGFEDVGQSPWFTRFKLLRNGNVILSVGKDKPGTLTINTYKDTIINTKEKTHINSGSEVVINAPKMQLLKAKAVPKQSGSLCCIPVCPMTGQPHVIDTALQLEDVERPELDAYDE